MTAPYVSPFLTAEGAAECRRILGVKLSWETPSVSARDAIGAAVLPPAPIAVSHEVTG